MPLPLILAAAALGALGGGVANSTRGQNAEWNVAKQKWLAEQSKKNMERTRAIANGQLTMGALQTTAQEKDNAMAAFKAKSVGEVAAAASGAKGGTPFYLLEQNIRDNLDRVNNASILGRFQMGQAALQAGGSLTQGKVQEAQSMWALGEAEGELNYLASPLAGGVSMATGAFEGASLAAGLEGLYTKATGDLRGIEGAIGDAFKGLFDPGMASKAAEDLSAFNAGFADIPGPGNSNLAPMYGESAGDPLNDPFSARYLVPSGYTASPFSMFSYEAKAPRRNRLGLPAL